MIGGEGNGGVIYPPLHCGRDALVGIALFLKEVPGGKVRGNLRAKSARDISVIAREMGGGGHPAAAGFTVEGDIDQALSTVLPKLRALYVEPVPAAEG